MGKFLEHYVAPYDLVSVSLFEDSHPNIDGYINAIITHTAGSKPAVLQAQGYELEQMFVPCNFEWDHLFRDAEDYINEKGNGWKLIIIIGVSN